MIFDNLNQIPSFNEVCQKFEQYRAQCNIDKTGCVHGLKDYTSKKCELNIYLAIPKRYDIIGLVEKKLGKFNHSR